MLNQLKSELANFSTVRYYDLFGISKVKSAAVSAFRSSYRPGDRSFAYTPPEQERISLQSLEAITDALLEIMEVSFNFSTSVISGQLWDMGIASITALLVKQFY